MSRYTHNLTHPKFGEVDVVYGFDRALEYYFIQVCPKGELHDPIFNISSHSSLIPHPDQPKKLNYSNSEIQEIYKELNVPKIHIDALNLDMPF